MIQNSEVTKAMIDAMDLSGTGAGGTRNISGTTCYITQLESTLSKLHDREASLVFSSGFVANEAALSTLPQLLTTAKKKKSKQQDGASETSEEEDVTCHRCHNDLIYYIYVEYYPHPIKFTKNNGI